MHIDHATYTHASRAHKYVHENIHRSLKHVNRLSTKCMKEDRAKYSPDANTKSRFSVYAISTSNIDSCTHIPTKKKLAH